METKPGVKTSEFWTMLIVNVLLFIMPLVIAHLEKVEAPWALAASSVAVGINSAAYHYSRGRAKSAAASGESNAQLSQTVAGLLAGIAAALPDPADPDDPPQGNRRGTESAEDAK